MINLTLTITRAVGTSEGRAQFTADVPMLTRVAFEAPTAEFQVGDSITVTIERAPKAVATAHYDPRSDPRHPQYDPSFVAGQ